jgi:hypothetical protein
MQDGSPVSFRNEGKAMRMTWSSAFVATGLAATLFGCGGGNTAESKGPKVEVTPPAAAPTESQPANTQAVAETKKTGKDKTPDATGLILPDAEPDNVGVKGPELPIR